MPEAAAPPRDAIPPELHFCHQRGPILEWETEGLLEAPCCILQGWTDPLWTLPGPENTSDCWLSSPGEASIGPRAPLCSLLMEASGLAKDIAQGVLTPL